MPVRHVILGLLMVGHAASQSCSTGAVFHGGGFVIDNGISDHTAFTMETTMYIDNLDRHGVVMWLDIGNLRYKSNGRAGIFFQFAAWESRQGGTGFLPHLQCQLPQTVNYRLPFHVAATATGSTSNPELKLFFNGVEATDCRRFNDNPSGSYESDTIGGHSCSSTGDHVRCENGVLSNNELMYGWLKWPRIWNSARSAQQIRSTMNTDVSASANGLVAAWDFQDAIFIEGGDVPDITGQHNGRFSFVDGGVHCDIPNIRVSQHVLDIVQPLEANISALAAASVASQAAINSQINTLASENSIERTQISTLSSSVQELTGSLLELSSARVTIASMSNAMSAMEASQSMMQSNIAQLTGQVSTQTAMAAELRSVLVTVASTAPSRLNLGTGNLPAVQAIGSNIAIKAPAGAISLESDSCELSDLCGITVFAENLQNALRDLS